MRRSRTLLSHLAAFALVVTLPLLVGLAIITYRFAVAERSYLYGLTEDAYRDIAAHVERELSTRIAMLEALAGANSLQDGKIPAFEQQLRELSLRTGVNFVLFDLAGQQLVNTGRPQGGALPGIADPEMIRGVARTKGVDVSNLLPGSGTGRFQARVAVPVMRHDDVVAVLASTISPERLVDVLKKGLPHGPFFATILDRAGVILARSVAPEKFIGKPFPALAAEATLDQGSISLVSAQGVPIVGYYGRSDLSGWIIVAAIEHSALTAPLIRSLWTLAVAAACLAALAIGGGWWIGRRMTRAHQALLAAAAAMGKGQMVVPTKTALFEANLVGQALAAASRSIARQAGELQQANQELEERVQSRTRELARKTVLLETTLNAMNQGLIVIDADGRVPVSNSQARRMLALPDALMDRHPTIDEVFATQERAGEFVGMTAGAVRLLKQVPNDERNIFERQRRDGTVLEVQTVPIYGAAGGFLRTYTDITAHRQHARALEEARDAAERANRAKDDFLATMGHEMRTPLNAVIGYSEQLIRVGILDSSARRSAERIRGAASALLCLVDDVLDIEMIEAGILDIRAEPFSLDALVDEAASMVRPSALDKGLELNISADAMSRGFFLGDQDRLRQILLNLLNNAIKFTPAGAVHLSVSGRTGKEGRHILRFTVADTGIGIGKAEQTDVFQRFYQVDPATDRRLGGVGLGLAICKHLVERMGGSIGVESDLRQGSMFWFELGLVPASVESTAVQNILRKPCSAHILVAEDVVMNQELARELLESAGHTVEIVSNGAEAVEAVKRGAYDLVLMDLSMPEMDGLTATRQIRAADIPAASIPIVACTANVLPARVTALRDAGVDAYLRKPLRPAELHATVARVLVRGSDQSPGEILPSLAEPVRDDVLSIVSLLGPKRVIAALDGLAEDLKTLALADASDSVGRGQLGERAHAIISTASMLGMTELAERCRDLENACRQGTGVTEALERLSGAAEIALAQGSRMREDLEPTVA